eukprot:TRINITY_DN57616_c0_g1_i1.p1 TRINITY_DN57616_c0_g1~~TRINITY_DN57616_c0_g1_i1.p1  ORF type:complete len:370 (-),score=107.58 TRINITY_DN57616_c0_g1_i1:281-1273(-)
MVNEKVFRVRFEDQEELAALRSRLGQVMLFPFVQPEQGSFDWNLSIHDERLAASVMVYIAVRERFYNLRNATWVHSDGVVDPMTMGVPRSWESFEKIPSEGSFHVEYACAPEDRNFKVRKQLFETYGFWKTDACEAEVMWWAGIGEAPSDVLELLEFLISHFEDVYRPFKLIDGPGGNGEITLRELEEGLDAIGCQKFEGPDKAKRIANIFRYLDPSESGEVSEQEWGALECLWKEMMQSIREFVQFLERTFGGDPGEDFLQVAWAQLDEDGSGEVSEEEWVEVIKDKLQYFGPSLVIFNFIDKDDEGTVSQDEFQVLETMRVAPLATGT